MKRRRAWVLGAAIAAPLVVAGEKAAPAQSIRGHEGPCAEGAGPAEGRCVDPMADGLLRRMSDYLGGLRQFGVVADHATEVVLDTGQKLELTGSSHVFVKRPNKVRSDRRGQLADLSLYYDGATMTILGRRHNLYATAEAPPTLDGAIDFGRNELDLEVPAADLLYSDPYRVLMEDVISGAYIGRAIVNGVTCHHLAYRGNETDWQIWIQDGPRPLPCKYVIVSKHVASAPEFSVELHDWEVDVNIVDDIFHFVPPPGADRIDFLRVREQMSPAGQGGVR
ncbi:MAG: DUF2092 domain-containing protein [Polyangiaceae bacterium]|nr:DUF2092 domain-containing protein [Polyangiaceae bacterium]